MKIVGICSGHDVSYAVLEDGIPIVHNEKERFSRIKEQIGDGFGFLFDTYDDVDDIVHASYCVNNWHGGIAKRFPDTFNRIKSIVEKNGGRYWPNEQTTDGHNAPVPGHHQCHAANAFFSSNFEESLVITMDGGGEDYTKDGKFIPTTFTAWKGIDNKIYEIGIIPIEQLNIGWLWDCVTTKVFGLSGGGPPYGCQAGTVMGMAALGDSSKFRVIFDRFLPHDPYTNEWDFLRDKAEESEQNQFDIAASLQEYTDRLIKEKIGSYLKEYNSENLCLSGGVALNSVMTGQIRNWFPTIKNVYVDPIPYDAGIALGGPRYIWHHILDNPRIKWKDNSTSYLGHTYPKSDVMSSLEQVSDKVKYKVVDDEHVVDLLIKDDNVISVFGGGSESGRRALGNRSILANPTSPTMKDVINEKVKHRQWFRPFAPSILREEVKNWFEQDIDSPYMSFVIPFKKELVDKVPAVVHFDGSARLQTVTENDNKWYYNFIKSFGEKTGVPIVLNTSFNDREPIVETPEHAFNCFLKTDIDYLYFFDYKILVSKV
tara:strand:- start:1233 stop:2858 length:1626 start_codon:yes stop_codon:yes gene_type:complete